jgi:hypothetical protein
MVKTFPGTRGDFRPWVKTLPGTRGDFRPWVKTFPGTRGDFRLKGELTRYIPNKQASKGKTREITATISDKKIVDFAKDTEGYI